ncbi:MAG: hypothetical protein JNM93_11880 [Bacteriovoracaceae bacterium]|nr:hypothetical protein [Bacteriovoracaceae bacterium]
MKYSFLKNQSEIRKLMKNGFIFFIAERFVKIAYYFNLVELIKFLTARIEAKFGNTKGRDAMIWAKGLGIDIYIVLKWLAVMIFWLESSENTLAFILTAYLLWSNVFTYFFYHVWENRHLNDVNWQRRRFISLFQSISFNVFGFAYLYRFFAKPDLKWLENLPENMEGPLSLMFSCLNLFGAGSILVTPQTFQGVILLTIQTIITFIFITLILSNTQINKDS